jgi:DNA/RNA endonuclease YhcR with UshA esterase domain
MRFFMLVMVLSFTQLKVLAEDATRPIPPTEALTKIDQKVTVQMEVKSTGGNTARYLNSEADFKSEKNFAIFIPNAALPAFKKAEVDDPGKHYYGKTIVVSGTVALVQNRSQIRVEDPSQIKVLTNNPTQQPTK